MNNSTTKNRFEAKPETMKTLEDFVREGARRMLQAALEAEVDDFVEGYKKHGEGKRIVVMNGRMPERTVISGAGPIAITRPRVDDRSLEGMGKERELSRCMWRVSSRSTEPRYSRPVKKL